ncbi:hypothetical protein [Streptomyces sp. NBC_01565]|uniref:hypothetical protein n=1 Tax=Streptomyces sp. NBC_01565 TaxID=2975881 RepID=UPI0022572AB4|nr:hypothetical protein [Streptomyces sp. NBC_01565]MCX4543826.1 hypothetical protein [Streptomyces sp. NBC_01565]
MTAYEWCEVIAIGALLVGAVTWLNRGSNADDDTAEFQRTAAEAAASRPEDEVRRELAATKVQLTEVERQVFAQTVAAEFRKTIPNQTRRTEEDQ